MEKKVRTALSIATLLSLVAPMNESWPIGILFYLEAGTIQTFFYVIPDILWSVSYFVSEHDIYVLLGSTSLLAYLGWIFALPLLLLWNLYLIKPRITKQKTIYRIWLFLSLISSISYGGVPLTSFQTGNYTKIGYFLNPALLIVATGFEIWLWYTERRMKTLE